MFHFFQQKTKRISIFSAKCKKCFTFFLQMRNVRSKVQTLHFFDKTRKVLKIFWVDAKSVSLFSTGNEKISIFTAKWEKKCFNFSKRMWKYSNFVLQKRKVFRFFFYKLRKVFQFFLRRCKKCFIFFLQKDFFDKKQRTFRFFSTRCENVSLFSYKVRNCFTLFYKRQELFEFFWQDVKNHQVIFTCVQIFYCLFVYCSCKN